MSVAIRGRNGRFAQRGDFFWCQHVHVQGPLLERPLITRRLHILRGSTLRAFWSGYPDAEEPLLAWYREVEKADWSEPSQVKEQFRSASFPKGNRVVFNIKGNDYRLVVRINYPYRVVYVRFVGTHAQYDQINVKEV